MGLVPGCGRRHGSRRGWDMGPGVTNSSRRRPGHQQPPGRRELCSARFVLAQPCYLLEGGARSPPLYLGSQILYGPKVSFLPQPPRPPRVLRVKS